MSPRIQGDGGRLGELKAAAERVVAAVGADGLPPATRADAVALATFVRDLLADGPRAYEHVTYDAYDGDDVHWLHEFKSELLVAAKLRRSSRPSEGYALYRVGGNMLDQAVHPGSRPTGEKGK